jgi:hypothetical protein
MMGSRLIFLHQRMVTDLKVQVSCQMEVPARAAALDAASWMERFQEIAPHKTVLKLTQVDVENILRRSREWWLRN